MDYLERMKEELKELDEKIDKLTKFLTKEIKKNELTDEAQRTMMHVQRMYMIDYSEALKARIKYEEFKRQG